jgi:hypothetical protein
MRHFLPSCPHGHFCTFRRELSSLRRTVARQRTARNVLELSGVSERPMIMFMTTTGRPQQLYDHLSSASVGSGLPVSGPLTNKLLHASRRSVNSCFALRNDMRRYCQRGCSLSSAG